MTEADPQRPDTDILAPYAMRWYGKNGAQSAKLPKMSRTARAFTIRHRPGCGAPGRHRCRADQCGWHVLPGRCHGFALIQPYVRWNDGVVNATTARIAAAVTN